MSIVCDLELSERFQHRIWAGGIHFSYFSCVFLNPNDFFNLNCWPPICSKLLHMRNLQEKVKKSILLPKIFWPFTAWIICSIDLKIFTNSWPSAIMPLPPTIRHMILLVWDHPFKTSACLAGGGVSPCADGQKSTVHKDQKSPSQAFCWNADGRGIGVKNRENLPTS